MRFSKIFIFNIWLLFACTIEETMSTSAKLDDAVMQQQATAMLKTTTQTPIAAVEQKFEEQKQQEKDKQQLQKALLATENATKIETQTQQELLALAPESALASAPAPASQQPEKQQQQVAVSTAATSTTTTTTMAPLVTERSMPEYLQACYYIEDELCREWYTSNGNGQDATKLAEATAHNGDPLKPHNDYDEHNQNNNNGVGAGAGAGAGVGNIGIAAAADNDYLYNQRQRVDSCQCRPHATDLNSWYCCNITHMSMITSCNSTPNWSNLHIRNLTIPQLDLSKSTFRSLQALSITDGQINQVINTFPRHSPIKCLNISNNNIAEISPRAVSNVPNLMFLGIANNNLSRVPNWNQNHKIFVDISGNMGMGCYPLFDAIYSDSLEFVKAEESICSYRPEHQWFNTTDIITVKQLKRFKQCRTNCPRISGIGNCTCGEGERVLIQGDQWKAACIVDCSNMGLTELPHKLPDNTMSLNVSNNRIRSLGDHFQSNPTYRSVYKFYAENNQLTSMNELEGTGFIAEFLVLNMRNNSLAKIPEYFLNIALRDNSRGRRIYLGGNKITCDCNTAKILWHWLKEHSNDIPDYMAIGCGNMKESVAELQEKKLCQGPPDWTDYVNYVIAVEAILLISLIIKVLYDYWIFKTAGYLPWPANKTPKLPCDCLCE